LQQPVNVSIRLIDPVRRAAFAVPLVQIAVGLIGAGIVAWFAGRPGATGFLAGAIVVASGQAIFGWRTALRSPVVSAGRAFGRLIVGAALKWLVIGAGLVLAMNAAGWPAGFVLGGALAALLAYVIGIPWLLR
jgi:hypothetical protein